MEKQTQIWIIKQKLTKKLTQKKKKMKKIPITQTEALSVVVGGEGSLVGGGRRRVAESIARWCELKRCECSAS